MFRPPPPRSIEELLARHSPRVRRLTQLLRRRVLAVVPEAKEKLRGGWGLIGYNAPAYFAFIQPMADAVRLGFEWGAQLDDPEHLLEGRGRQVRYVSIHSEGELRRFGLEFLLRQAAELKPPSRPSR